MPEYQYSTANVSKIEHTLKNSNHIVLDVSPEDAENHMRGRAERELLRIQDTLSYRNETSALSASNVAEIGGLIKALTLISDSDISQEIQGFLMEVKQSLGRLAGVEDLSSLANLFRGVGIVTNIREDDILPSGRANRIGNFYQMVDSNEGRRILLGSIAEVLVRDLDFEFDSEFGVVSLAPNCRVVANGESKDISLQGLQEQGQQIAQEVYFGLERQRILGEGVHNRNTEQI